MQISTRHMVHVMCNFCKRKIFFCEYNYFNYHTKARRKNVDSYTFLGILIRFSYDYFKNVCFANLRKMEKCETEMKILYDWALGVCLSWYKSSALTRRRDKHTPLWKTNFKKTKGRRMRRSPLNRLANRRNLFSTLPMFSFNALNRNCYSTKGDICERFLS